MGMAASQARFLQLTARRTNIEFMGQQINQQRVALANQSAGLFEKMLTLEPPTPPSSLDDQYYTQGYTFKDGVDNDGNAVYKGDDVNKKISWSTAAYAGAPATFDVTLTNTNGGAGAAGDSTVAVNIADLMQNEAVADTGTNLQAFFDGVGFQEQTDTARSVVRYVAIEHNIYDPDGNYQTVTEQAPAILEFDNLERLINVTLIDENFGLTATGDYGTDAAGTLDYADLTAATGATAAVTGSEIGQGEELTYSGVFDETAYNDDMNKYEFEKSAYDYQIERINLETAKIQKQDKSLELKMKQLDTEHKAIQTEMDAVSKVIQKNIESSFKTFG